MENLKTKRRVNSSQVEHSISTPKLVDIQPVVNLIKSIPSTRYYGSKKKLLPWIYEHLKALEFDSVLDGFGGTASVSLLFGMMGKKVDYHDGLYFNQHVAKSLFSVSKLAPLDDVEIFLEKVLPLEGVVSKNFKGVFFIEEENEWIDGFMELVDSEVCEYQKSALLYCLFQACLKKRPFNLFHRANLNLRLNTDVKRKFGNATTWETPFEDHIVKSYRELQAFRGVIKNTINVLPSKCISEVEPGYDLVYLDPPYVSNSSKNNSETYWKKYHFLEGLSTYKKWNDSIDDISAIRAMNQPDFIKDWNCKQLFKDKLFDLLERHKDSIVVLSYVSNAYPDQEEILDCFNQLFSEVSIHTKEYSHALSKSKRRELLFIGKP